MENKNVEDKKNHSCCSSHAFESSCHCDDDCACEGDCGDDCNCEDYEIEVEPKKKKKACCSDDCSGRRFFGLIIVFVGLAYLGKNMGWWQFEMNWSIFWPALLIFFGLMMIVKSGK